MPTILGSTKIDKLLEEIKSKAANTELRLGFLEGSTDENGESMPQRAFDNEYGANGPPRGFMRTTAKVHGKEWAKKVGHLIENQKWDFVDALQVVGDIAVKDMQETIQTWPKSPPNSPKTIARKKAAGWNPYDQPLVASGNMTRATSFEVKE